jgi:hypothetical protein
MKEAMTSSQYNIVLQNHMYGLPPDMYNKYPDLAQVTGGEGKVTGRPDN